MVQINENLVAHPHNITQLNKALKCLLVVNVVFYALSNLFQAEVVPTSQDLILLLLGFLSIEIQSVKALKAYINLSIISIAIDFLSLLSVVFLVSSLELPKLVDVFFMILFVIENYFKYHAITYARRIRDDWKSVQLPGGSHA